MLHHQSAGVVRIQFCPLTDRGTVFGIQGDGVWGPRGTVFGVPGGRCLGSRGTVFGVQGDGVWDTPGH